VPNAVDYDSYADRAIQRPDDMAGIEGPIIGYSGLIAARLDMSLLQDAAESRSDWNFVFVGTVNDAHCETEMQRLGDLPNVHLLGQKPVGEVPRYVHQFDVCVIPYVVNLRAQHASPLKLYEYAAASKPIVTTDFAAARAFQGHVSIAEDLNDFIAACERSLALDSSAPSITENRRFAAENTWKHRVQQISDILRDLVS
jgi:glycosyltransferase involved in cell wall biosynthesis